MPGISSRIAERPAERRAARRADRSSSALASRTSTRSGTIGSPVRFAVIGQTPAIDSNAPDRARVVLELRLRQADCRAEIESPCKSEVTRTSACGVAETAAASAARRQRRCRSTVVAAMPDRRAYRPPTAANSGRAAHPPQRQPHVLQQPPSLSLRAGGRCTPHASGYAAEILAKYRRLPSPPARRRSKSNTRCADAVRVRP